MMPDTNLKRKKFLLWVSALLGTVYGSRLLTGSKKINPPVQEEKVFVKMLTQDGKLVEVDRAKLSCGNRKKISDEQLKTWVNKDKTNSQL